jgi:long-chain fatty acid transport protein
LTSSKSIFTYIASQIKQKIMKKTILTIFSMALAVHFVLGGGIVTNTNQSASWVRSMVRDASVDVDAVFYNPAGLTHLEDGFYLQVNSQTALQSRTVSSTFPTLNDGTYEGSTFVPVLPTGFAVYKKGKLAISAGFTVIGGGGSAVFDRGLPEFEQDISTLPVALSALSTVDQALAVTGYNADIEFSGSSAYYGIQAGVSYQLNNMISAGIGGRYVMANNAYEGHIKDITVNTGVGEMRADAFLNDFAIPGVNQAADDLSALVGLPDLMTPFLPLIGSFTLTQLAALLGSGQIPEEQALVLSAYLGSVENAYNFMELDPNVHTLQQLNDGVVAATPVLSAQIVELQATSVQLSAQKMLLGDNFVDVTQSGTGFTPIISVDLNFLDGDLGLALKYEHKTTMKVTTSVEQDDTGLYTDGEEVTADMPAMISAGIRYNLTDAFRMQTGFHYYLDTNASYGKKDDDGLFVNNGDEVLVGGNTTTYLSANSYEAALGLEYDVNKMFTFSGGVLYTSSSPNDVYQSGLSYTLNTTTFGLGAKINVWKNLDIDLGYSNTSYVAYTKVLSDANFGSYEETYDKTASLFAVGLTFGF